MDDRADRFGQRGDFLQPHRHRFDSLRREPQPVDLGIGQPEARRRGQIEPVGFFDTVNALSQQRPSVSAIPPSSPHWSSPVAQTPAEPASPHRCSTAQGQLLERRLLSRIAILCWKKKRQIVLA